MKHFSMRSILKIYKAKSNFVDFHHYMNKYWRLINSFLRFSFQSTVSFKKQHMDYFEFWHWGRHFSKQQKYLFLLFWYVPISQPIKYDFLEGKIIRSYWVRHPIITNFNHFFPEFSPNQIIFFKMEISHKLIV